MNLIEKARAQIAIRTVFFASMAFNVPMIADESIPTAATDMKVILYNPKFFEQLKEVKYIIFVILHEIMHIVLLDGIRMGNRDPELWNDACDYRINLILKKAGFEIWPQALFDERFDGLSAEQIYDLLKNDEGRRPRANPMRGDLKKVAAQDEASRTEIGNSVRAKVAQAATQAQLAGQMPGYLKGIITALMEPEIDWAVALRRFMQRFVNEEENWSRRNRRYADFYLPAKYNQKLGEIVLIGDTSGSVHMCKRYYDRIATELNHIVSELHPERVRVIWADDTDCALQEVFEPCDEIDLHPQGGGGTDMTKPLKFVEQYDPLCVILVTDGYTPWPEDTPYPLIVLSTTDVIAPIGETFKVTT